jgi:hypothetical protein
MNWNMIGAIAELVGAAAVAVSLIYVALQVRFANRLARAEAYRAATTQGAILTAAQATDPVFRSAFHKVYVQQLSREDLTQDERTAVALWFTCQLDLMAQVHREVGLGILTVDAYIAWGEQINQLPYFRSLWPFVRSNYPADFAALVDSWFRSDATDYTRVLQPAS